MRIVLLGYMGSGKSTIGKELAKNINFSFYDLDQEIESYEKLSITDIFKKKGENYFRNIEHFILKKILLKDNFVLSLGGGTPIFNNNMNIINQKAESFYLSMNSSELSIRLNNETNKRPILSNFKGKKLKKFISDHLSKRKKFYKLSKNIVQINNQSIKEICNQIILKLNLIN